MPCPRCSTSPPPASRRSAERLKQRDIVAWIGLQDGSIGRIVEIRDGRFRSRAGTAAEARSDHVVQGRGDRPETAAAQSRSGRDHPRGQELQGGDHRAGRAGGLVHADPQHERDRRPAHGHADARRQPPLHHLHQWRPPVRLRQGRPDPAGHAASSSTTPTRPPG